MLLTDEQRKEFIAYCDTQINSNNAMMEQMNLIGAVPQVLIDSFKVKTTAYQIVRKDLASIETQTIQAPQ